jgi:hypothetical protein
VEIKRAMEILVMLTQSDLERERYEARLKLERDRISYEQHMQTLAMEAKEGREQGRAEGEQIGRIHLCEQFLNRPLTPTEQLLGRPLEELVKLADELQAQVLKE